jgi:hypothetical protein
MTGARTCRSNIISVYPCDVVAELLQQMGSLCGLIYALGLVVIWWAPDTSKKKLQE